MTHERGVVKLHVGYMTEVVAKLQDDKSGGEITWRIYDSIGGEITLRFYELTNLLLYIIINKCKCALIAYFPFHEFRIELKSPCSYY